jgi:hypothetical protein
VNSLLPIVGDHFLHKGRIFRVALASSGTDTIILEDIETYEKFSVMFSVFKFAYTRVWKIGDVAKFLGRSPRSIYRYESSGAIDKPKRYDAAGGRSVRFFTKQDVLDMHECLVEIHQGRPRKDGRVVNNSMPNRTELVTMFKERFGL